MNQGDSELMLGQLVEKGYTPARRFDEADVVIVNTCAVKGVTHRKMIRRLRELRANGKRVVVAGCLPLIDPASIEEVGDFGMVSCKSLNAITEVLECAARGERAKILKSPPLEKPRMPKLRSSEVSAIVAISEGCVSNCSYCSVKFARGQLRSFEPENILGEIEGALRAGHREILLTSQDTAAYGFGSNTSLPELLNSITSLAGEFRVRMGMMNPASAKLVLPELIDAYGSEKVYKFLHLPLQSGDDRVLERMRRGYTVDEFIKIVDEFRERFEDLYLATDVIVGFPGEGEEEFKRTCEVVEEIKPDKTNVSRFSPMPKTDAARMPQVEGREIANRSVRMSELCRRITLERNLSYVGRTMRGLVTGRGKKGGYEVRLPNYKLAIIQTASLGSFVNVRIVDAKPTYMLAEVVGA